MRQAHSFHPRLNILNLSLFSIPVLSLSRAQTVLFHAGFSMSGSEREQGNRKEL